MKSPSNSCIIICGIVRNAERGLKKNIPAINEFLTFFKDYRIFIYENDSTDNTKSILQGWANSDSERIHVSLNNVDSNKTIPSGKMSNGVNPFFSHKRIDKMASIRNYYLEYIYSKGWDADYLMIVDLDVAQILPSPILTSFNTSKNWDGVTAFGYSFSPKLRRRYHDTYALTLWGDQDNPQTEKKIHYYAEKLGQLSPSDEWVRIASGFGGLAIFRYEVIKGLFYSVPALENHDPRVEVKCEHFSIFKQMIERGYDQFFINPAMVLKYQNITLKIVWNSVKRKLGY